jgi:alpha-galactosidase
MPRHTRPTLLAVLVLALATSCASPDPDVEVPDVAAAGPSLAPTPPMGWNTWYGHFCDYDAADVEASAQALVDRGLFDVGYQYVVLDDCWQRTTDDDGAEIVFSRDKVPPPDQRLANAERLRDANGDLVPRFDIGGPDGLAARVHAKGRGDRRLKFGIYTDVGTHTCERRAGSFGHARQDVERFASWGVDFVKVDWCYLMPDTVGADAYGEWREAIDAVGHAMLLSICNWGEQAPWTWAPGVGETWRTTGDISAASPPSPDAPWRQWDGVLRNADLNAEHADVAGPNRWNDPDFLLTGTAPAPVGLTLAEGRSQMSLFSIMSAPLFISAGVAGLTDEEVAVVGAPEVIAVDQDPTEQGRRIRRGPIDGAEIWMKRLAEPGARAVVLFNRSEVPATISVSLDELGLAPEVREVRDLWRREALEERGPTFTREVPPHDVVMLKIVGAEG